MSPEDRRAWQYNRARSPKPWHQLVLNLAPPTHAFPLLQLTPDPANTTEVVVGGRPAKSLGNGPIWTVMERPAVHIGSGHLITLKADGSQSGVGRLTVMTDLRRHWITWKIEGGPTTCNLRVPIPWARLSSSESDRHTQEYRLLKSLPPPHYSFIIDPDILYPNESPYEFEGGDDVLLPPESNKESEACDTKDSSEQGGF
ncbi:uncharacterized protein C8Q71DRAFT_854343 [Rhodofomes roseus]|uniref:Uncharacterized protein n=1 Tax=Rhodofomes roseus TaxID=34475 RepID=A0ABQ8KT44_9APHY|nr:uncharacterized protein C8Q71DRAFT_856182 [Rhodofomes roseus]XP_047783269.1 uncharacterized protein C8Q71DRAFT_854322 [Rhodofomes roseus]XP_047783284.1 uncharacterized protein C8Q71DRAFT_854343 [Rhodofomes roseus]KAH9838218.1 hypothetical protein C8Q71DRAFT_856182 [Rhodofomes roseus]KAH9841970.1 hypothetical protein C8Q71DRAFT_854322 [Rhodofomes roseus]KAH9841985.1 hypothetical protein C8Q71DRAFT_854343 [Rhodofomes roseus]